MQKKGANISLKGYDDIFSTDQSRAEAQQERVQEIPLSELHPFEGHPFRVVDDEEMMKTAESVRDFGVLTPAIVRPDPDGGYEIVSGHRRHRASELAGKETMPAIVRDLDDDAAIILMVDANLQRESILPSERAFAYKMKLDAIKHQGQRTDLTSSQEVRTRTTSSTDPETGETTTEEEDYEYYILNVKLRNKGLNSVISNSGLSEDDMERYRILLQTRGNRPDIFGNDIYATPGGEYTDYDIPGEALTDTRFANMIREAEKYLGYPYVWGGSSPSTSFDCSGFVSYVINHCGNGWSVGRLTANGLMGVCDIIPKSSAKPGDLIFFQGTYDTSGASHVGIYVGNGMMIHCGNPISYASIESNYWQQHFYCFGRIRN